ncbi:hypothetical protein CLI64_28910 [Nostoc sp. CENA543]|uniref:DUF3124 domain-containing protein n=1 Tax=Nostoc sp. CENA543 TaxID=1869241 RepID=UPI000CA18066|nr:DUF3124 domain-containing protein [Nostoc sp. CENA543]AUT04077.1 hypothetical protein CLI64_28910 [Nostoc sp. CENA543]
MKLSPHFYLTMAFILLIASCTPSESSSQLQSQTHQVKSSQKVVNLDKNFQIAMGQTLYVPIYSHIYHDDRQQVLNLAATLSIRNTDLMNPLIITSVRYYDSNGKLVKQYLEQPIQIDALASSDFYVSRSDTTGGLGANFIVEWVAQTEISEPIVEAVMIATEFQQGISFVSSGRVIKSYKQSKR